MSLNQHAMVQARFLSLKLTAETVGLPQRIIRRASDSGHLVRSVTFSDGARRYYWPHILQGAARAVAGGDAIAPVGYPLRVIDCANLNVRQDRQRLRVLGTARVGVKKVRQKRNEK